MVVWSLTCGLADLPRVAHALLKLDLPCLHEGSVVSLRDLHRRVPEEYRDLIDGNSGEQHLDRKGVAEHVGMATLQLAIEPSDISQLEETAIGSLPVSHDRFGGSIAAPEEIAWVRPGTIGDIHQCIDDMGGKRHIDRLPGLGLIEQEAVAMQTVPFKGHRVADAEPAPAHQ